jgi:DNA-binding NtrC family response regulator
VLLVEDEESVRRVAERVLASNGYHVVGVSNGTEALSLLKSDGVGIGVVVTDVAMPGMSGTELVAELRELRPDLSVILMSGFSAEVVGSTGLDLGRFIQKPLVPEELLAKVSDALHTWGREA